MLEESAVWQRMTDHSRSVFAIAESASQSPGRQVGVGDLLAALMMEGGGLAAIVLQGLGLSIERITDAAKDDANTSLVRSDGELTTAGERVIEFSLREALQLGQNYVGTEHLLLALARYEERRDSTSQL